MKKISSVLVSIVALVISSTLLISCSSSPTREVASTPELNPERVRYLKQAAEAGVLFMVSDAAFRDLPTKQVGACKKSEEAPWADQLLNLLEALDQNAKLYSKIHLIEIRRGDNSNASIEKDGDGLARLVISYSKRTSFEKINSLTELPCDAPSASMNNKNLEITRFEWPSKELIIGTLANADDRTNIDKFNFDRKFLVFLAERLTLLRVSQDQVYEKTMTGEFALTYLLNKLGAEVSGGQYSHIDFWMKEIGIRSKQASNVEFFSFVKDFKLSYGVRVDSAGKFARRINNYSDPTYLYLSFKSESGSYVMPSLQDLNTCLEGLTNLYRSPDFASTLDTDKDSYLYPGYHCTTK